MSGMFVHDTNQPLPIEDIQLVYVNEIVMDAIKIKKYKS